MKVLVIGNGAREHALAWKIKQSPQVDELFVAPGNAGTTQIACNIDISPTKIDELLKFAQERNIDLTVVGPEAPLALGIVDRFSAAELKTFGASKKAAEIESSKAFAKDLMQTHGIPCAKSETFAEYGRASDYLAKSTVPVVIKVDGLAAGKGVVVAQSKADAQQALADFMGKKTLGTAGDRIIIEEFLSGKEVSVFALTDGETVKTAVAACDYKTVFEGNRGPNTGGMGSFSPPFFWTTELGQTIHRTIIEPVVKAMAKTGRPYKGVLYAGLMITADGPKVLEFNARFGDPETQCIMPLLETDLVDIMLAIAGNSLGRLDLNWSDDACIGVVLASDGYPGVYKTGLPITGLEKVDKDIMVFHAGTGQANGSVVTSGGRVLTVTARAPDISRARQKVYDNIMKIHFAGCHYRKDLGFPGR